jgi:hypothetical protein
MNKEVYSKLNRKIVMNEKEIKKAIYEKPVLTKQQVILEQVIAAGSTARSNYGEVRQEWTEESLDCDQDIIL